VSIGHFSGHDIGLWNSKNEKSLDTFLDALLYIYERYLFRVEEARMRVTLSTCVSVELARAVEARATQARKSVSSLLREAIEDLVSPASSPRVCAQGRATAKEAEAEHRTRELRNRERS
jgi:hypothetical protein